MEFIIGSRNKIELQRSSAALRSFNVVPIDPGNSNLAHGLIERHCLSTGLGLADFLIAAQALNRSAILYTFNLKHFGAIPGLDARAPYVR